MRTISSIASGRPPGQVVIQYSDACNASCPQCELRASNLFPRSRVPLDDIKRAIDRAAKTGVRALSVTGGEPFLFRRELIEILTYAREAGIPYTRTGTNGFPFRNSDGPGWEKRIRNLARELAESGVYTLWISVDSADAGTHEKMRGLPGVIRGIEKALPIFHEHGVYPAANLGVNRNVGGEWKSLADGRRWLGERETYLIFRRSFADFYNFVIGLGFTMANACYPMSSGGFADGLDSVYGASSADEVVNFSDKEKASVFAALFDVIPAFRDKIRIFTPRCSLYSLIRRHSGKEEPGYACRGGIDYFFISAASGNVYPCGFRGTEDLGKFWEMKLDKNEKPSCRLCDWECFRDPSELLGPIFEARNDPAVLFRRVKNEPGFMRLWLLDLEYYRACSFFSGRVAPDYKRMTRVAKRQVRSVRDPGRPRALGAAEAPA